MTVTGAASFRMRFNTTVGGGIDQLFDLVEDPTGTYDLAGGVGDLRTLHDFEVAPGSGGFAGVNHQTDDNSVGAKADLLEVTRARVRVRQDAFFQQDGGTNILGGLKGIGDYSVYGSGRSAIRWTETDSNAAAFFYGRRQIGMTAHYTAGAPLSSYTPCYEGNPACNTSGGGGAAADWLLGVRNVANARTDFLTILAQDWTQATTIEYLAINTAGVEFSDQVWQEQPGGGASALPSQTWNLLTYFKPTNLGTGASPWLDPAVISRSNDYRTPSSLAVLVGGPWTMASENSTGDDFNEAEAAYVLTMDPTTGLTFRMDGSVATPRYKPFFKMRQWRSLVGPGSVTLQGAPLAANVDYRADVKPVARAHYAQDFRWHSTLQNAAAVDHARCRERRDLDRGGLRRRPLRTGSHRLRGGTRPGPFLPHHGGRGGDRQLRSGLRRRGLLAQAHLREHGRGSPTTWPASSWTPTTTGCSRSSRSPTICASGSRREAPSRTARSPPGTIPGGPRTGCTCGSSGTPRPRGSVRSRRSSSTASRPPRTGPGSTTTTPTSTWERAASPSSSETWPTATASSGPEPTTSRIPGVVRKTRRTHSPTVASPRTGPSTWEAPATTSISRSTPSTAFNRNSYAYFGSDSQFRGLNIGLQRSGTGVADDDLDWEYWNGTAWTNLESVGGFADTTRSFKRSGAVYWQDPPTWAPYSVSGGPDLYYVRAHLKGTSAGYPPATTPIEGLIKTDILLLQYCGDITAAAQEFVIGAPLPTAVTLQSWEASSADSAVDLSWTTSSELQNLGFHLYRSGSAAGPFTRITAALIPGQGSSPTGASYSYRDGSLVNGQTYFYELEDVETTGQKRRHGPVSAVAGGRRDGGGGDDEGSGGGDGDRLPSERTYGEAGAPSLRILERGSSYAVLELRTPGFRAVGEAPGAVQIELPGFELPGSPGFPAVPVRRAFVDARAGRGARIASVSPEDEIVFTGLRVATEGTPEIVVTSEGTVRPGLLPRKPASSATRGGYYPRAYARLLGAVFQGETKKVRLELSPLRYDASSGRVVLARRLVVRVEFAGSESREKSLGGSLGRRPRAYLSRGKGVVAQLVTKEEGLYEVPFERVLPRSSRGIPLASLRLSRRGEAVPFHVLPPGLSSAPGRSSTSWAAATGIPTETWSTSSNRAGPGRG